MNFFIGNCTLDQRRKVVFRKELLSLVHFVIFPCFLSKLKSGGAKCFILICADGFCSET